jgi:glycosyltransferase involved in cell wall biosynthesis
MAPTGTSPETAPVRIRPEGRIQMRIVHYVKKEVSGLYRTAIEICKAELEMGHEVLIQEPQGQVIWGKLSGPPDVHVISSQYDMRAYHSTRHEWGIEVNTPVFLLQHGEPISSVGNGISMRSVVDLSMLCDALICMRKEEQPIWNSIKRCFYVGKGVDLEVFTPRAEIHEKLRGAPSVLYYESWRGSRNPLILCKAMELVWKRYPEAKLHLYNMSDQRMLETFKALRDVCKWYFIGSLQGPVKYEDVPALVNRVDMVGSCLFPLYARTPIEALACGKACVAPGYPGDPINGYPFTCTLNAESMAEAICAAHENKDHFDFRAHAVQFHDLRVMVSNMLHIYEGYLHIGRSTGMSLVRAS